MLLILFVNGACDVAVLKRYSGLQKNSSFTNFEKISVTVDWVNIKVCLISHLKGLTSTFELM